MAKNCLGMVSNTRRKVLKSGAVTVALAGLAGCSGGGGNGNSDGTMEQVEDPDGEPVEEITLLSIAEGDAPARYEYGLMVRDQLEQLGFQVEYDAQPTPQYLESRAQEPFPWNLQVRRAGDGYEPAEAIFRSWFHSSNIGSGQSNLYGYENPEVDDLIDQQASETDPEARTELIHEIQQILREDMPIVPLLTEERVMPLNTDRFQNPQPMLETGLGSFWNYVNIEPVDDASQIRTAMPESLNALNPLDQTARGNREVLRLIYDRLMRVNTDLEPEPWAAENVEYADDTTIEVTLRDGMTFHDGEPVTAEDVKFSYEYGAQESPGVETMTEPIDSITVNSDTELTFSLSEPNAPFLISTLSKVFIIPQHIWEDVPDSVEADAAIDWENPEAIGSGPFQVESANFDSQVQLSAFEDHFHPPNVDGLSRAIISGLRAGIRAYESGDLDMLAWGLPVQDQNRFESDSSTELLSSLMASIHHIGYNLREPPFDDPVARRAVAYAIPQRDIIDTIYGGTGSEIHNPMSPGFDNWYWDDVEEYGLDLDQATQLLSDAGYQWDTDGRLHYPAE